MEYRRFDPSCLLSPVPAVMVSCAGERPNIITLAWAGTVCSDPPMVSVSIRKSRHSHRLISESGEFVVNLVDAAHCGAMDFCGVKSGRDVDKFAACGLTPVPGPGMDAAPAIDGCPVFLGCKVRQTLELGSHDLFLGEVVGVQVREDLMDADNSLHLERAGLVCYSHGIYQRTGEILGFFGYSVARPEVLERRMQRYRSE